MSEVSGISKDIEWIRESLERIEGRLDGLNIGCRERHHDIDRDLAALRVKAGLYGALAGAVPAAVSVLVILLRHL
ncbi:MAG: hypothetical protein WCX65_02310 [bacterium]